VDDDLSAAGLVVAKDPNLRLVGHSAFELVKILRVDLDVPNDGMCVLIP
jgi:hypothetical protein